MDDPELWEYDGRIATRATSGTMINRLAKRLPNLVGGSADLAPSNKTNIKDGGDYSAENRAGRNIHFGVREHAMAAICNGMALHGGLRVFCGTFFVFSDYMKHAMRMSAIMKPARHLCAHARFHRRWRGRRYPRARGAAGRPARHPRSAGDSAPPTARKPPPPG